MIVCVYFSSLYKCVPTWMIIPVSKWLVTPQLIGYLGHVEGVPQPYLGDLLIMVINDVSKSWDDPPSSPMM